MATVTATKSTSKYSFAERFGLVHLRGGSVSIPAALDRYEGELGLSIGESWFISKILHQKWTAAIPYVSLKKLATATRRPPKTLHRIKDSLVAKGYLVIQQRRDPKRGKMCSGYDFSPLFKILQEKLERDGVGEDNPIDALAEEHEPPTPPSVQKRDGVPPHVSN